MFELLDSVVLTRDLPEHGLKTGDLGAIVEVYPPEGLEVEFVKASGGTQIVATLRAEDVRKVSDDDLLSVRPVDRPGS